MQYILSEEELTTLQNAATEADERIAHEIGRACKRLMCLQRRKGEGLPRGCTHPDAIIPADTCDDCPIQHVCTLEKRFTP